MKKRILFLLLTVMTLLSNTVFSQTFDNPFGTYTINLVPTTTLTSVTDVLSITYDTDSEDFVSVDTLAQGNDSIIYEFDNYIGNINLSSIMNITYNGANTSNCYWGIIKNDEATTSNYVNEPYFITTFTSTLIFTTTYTTYKIVNIYENFGSNRTKLTFYVRNYQVAKLPSNTVIPFVANFSSSVTSYTATSLPTTITLPAPTSTVTWTQVLSYTTSNCVTYTEGANTLQDCDTLTTLFISNNNSNVNYTITYNRPAQDVTSVKEVKNATSVITYPNPCKDFIKVRFNTEQSVLPIELYNLQGQLLLQNNEKRKLGDNEIEFNTQKLPNGVYFVKNGAQTVKFIKE